MGFMLMSFVTLLKRGLRVQCSGVDELEKCHLTKLAVGWQHNYCTNMFSLYGFGKYQFTDDCRATGKLI